MACTDISRRKKQHSTVAKRGLSDGTIFFSLSRLLFWVNPEHLTYYSHCPFRTEMEEEENIKVEGGPDSLGNMYLRSTETERLNELRFEDHKVEKSLDAKFIDTD